MHKFVNIVGAGVIALMIGYVGDVPNAVAAEDCYRVPGTDIIQKDDRLVANCFAAKGNSYMAELYRRSAEAKAKLNADITTSMAFYAKYCTGGTLHIGGSKADATRAWCAPSQINTIETASGTRGFPEGSNATMDWIEVGVFQKRS